MQDVEEQVLQEFARQNATTLPTSALFDHSGGQANADVTRALTDLEQHRRLLIRYTWDGTDWVTLTELGSTRRSLATNGTRERRRDQRSAPPQIVCEHPHPIKKNDSEYSIYVLGAERPDGTWAGWLEFVPSANKGRRLRTPQETSQPNRDAVAYWASGLEDLYFDGALARASAL